jgi:hypothetical protein
VEKQPLTTNSVEEYNGTSWTAGGNLTAPRFGLGGCAGTQTSALIFGGRTVPDVGVLFSSSFEYNGTAWTAGGSLGTAREGLAGSGTQTLALGAGGNTPGSTEEYDGTSWTAGGNMNTGRGRLGGAGTQTASLAFGGYQGPGAYALTELYDGSTWTNGGNLLSAKNSLPPFSASSQTAGITMGGENGFTQVGTTDTQEYTGGNATVTFTTS